MFLTASLVEDDPRLRDEVRDWWHQFSRLVSQSRLTRLARRFDRAVNTSVETYWEALEEWLVSQVIGGESSSTEGMLEGVFVVPGQKARKPAHFVSAVLPRIASDPTADALECLDLVRVPTVADSWAWSVVSTDSLRTYSHALGLSRGESQRFVTWALGAPQTYDATLGPPVSHGKIARLYGAKAASSARRDQDVIQIHLVRV